MEGKEPADGAAIKCSDDCPFCKDKKFLGYHTKHGALKDETVLGRNLRKPADVTSDRKVGKVYPLPGGNDPTIGWEAKSGVLEDFAVKLAAAPHHLIPGKASMVPSTLEKWTLASKEKIKEDIGYNIDCAQNGVFLPHLPEIYWTRHFPGTKTPMATHFGQTWEDLSPTSKGSIGDLVMTETSLQMHFTDHDDPYIHVDNTTNYDDECELECNELADVMQQRADLAKCRDNDGKLAPPYTLVARINRKSSDIKARITGNPRRWTSWVSVLAQNLTNTLSQNASSSVITRNLIRRLTKARRRAR